MLRSEEHTSELQSRQYLPSFPTRRSSDLSSLASSAAPPLTAPPSDGTLPSSGSPAPSSAPSISCGGSGKSAKPSRAKSSSISPTSGAGSSRYRARCSDRKSTRLNSSHANIFPLSLHDALPISPPWLPRPHPRLRPHPQMAHSLPRALPHHPRHLPYHAAVRENLRSPRGRSPRASLRLAALVARDTGLDAQIGRAHV